MSDGQTKKGSLFEALANTLIGYIIAIATQVVVFPWFGVHVSLAQDMSIGLIFMVVSIVRGYCLRRMFNRIRNG